MAAENFVLEPTFAPELGGLVFETDRINAFMEAEYNDNFGFYQQNFGVYSYMTLTKKLKYKIHYMEGLPLLWQPNNSCSWSPMGGVQWGNKEIIPCEAKMQVENCHDELYTSVYESFLNWERSGRVNFDPAYIRVVNEFVNTIGKNATLGARMTLTAGQLFDGVTETFKTDTATNIETMFKTSVGVCQGWIDLLIDTAAADATKSHLDGGYVTTDDISADSTQFVGDSRDSLALYDQILAASPQPLYDAVIEGGIGGFGPQFYPLFLVSPSIYRKIDLDYKAQRSATATNEPRIRKEAFTVQGVRGARTIYVYMIDETVVVPIHEPAHFTRHLTGTPHFAYLTVSGAIQLGSSFTSLPVVGRSDVAMMVQFSDQLEDLGKAKMASNALFATAINDTDFICGDYLYAEPA
jgi:hypothetical protein